MDEQNYDDYIETEESLQEQPVLDRNYLANVYEAQKWYSDPEAKVKFPELIIKDITLSNLTPINQKLILIYADLYQAFADLASIEGYDEIAESKDFVLGKIMMLSATCRAIDGFERKMTISQIAEQRKYFTSERGLGEKKRGFNIPFFSNWRRRRQGYSGGGY